MRVNGETKLLEIDKVKQPMPYPEAADAAARSARSDSENCRRLKFRPMGTEIGYGASE